MEEAMPDMTEEEYDALDEYYTKNPPQIDPEKEAPAISPAVPQQPVPQRLIIFRLPG
jgi:hypothetical protein